jgi:hypothetical protein
VCCGLESEASFVSASGGPSQRQAPGGDGCRRQNDAQRATLLRRAACMRSRQSERTHVLVMTRDVDAAMGDPTRRSSKTEQGSNN